jgi:ribosome-associated heat shock protein Hsp15
MTDKIRLDKWLWAARFYKTRSLCKQAIEGGKIKYDGANCKVSKEVQIGAMLTIRQGWDERIVEVIALSDQRRGAPEAQLLYQETEASIAARQQTALQRKLTSAGMAAPQTRPTKKDRRQIHRFKQDNQFE